MSDSMTKKKVRFVFDFLDKEVKEREADRENERPKITRDTHLCNCGNFGECWEDAVAMAIGAKSKIDQPCQFWCQARWLMAGAVLEFMRHKAEALNQPELMETINGIPALVDRFLGDEDNPFLNETVVAAIRARSADISRERLH